MSWLILILHYYCPLLSKVHEKQAKTNKHPPPTKKKKPAKLHKLFSTSCYCTTPLRYHRATSETHVETTPLSKQQVARLTSSPLFVLPQGQNDGYWGCRKRVDTTVTSARDLVCSKGSQGRLWATMDKGQHFFPFQGPKMANISTHVRRG